MSAEHPDPARVPNPDYGRGATRRRIRLAAEPGVAQGRLIDTFHEMTVRLEHDAGRVTAIEGASLRIPQTNCPGAVAVLQELVGLPLATPAAEIYAGGRARRHCTHLLDLAVLVLAQAARGEAHRVYDAVVPDETDAPIDIEVCRDDEPVHRWRVRGGAILAPVELAGRAMGRGFAAWSSAQFSGDALEAAGVLSRTWFIARGRTLDIGRWVGQPTAINRAQRDSCYGYASVRADDGRFLGDTLRDFSAGIPPET